MLSNAFVLSYKKDEDMVTQLFLHVLAETNLATNFLSGIDALGELHNCNFNKIDTQLHGKFDREVEKAYILGISSTNTLIEGDQKEQKIGHPDGWFYDEANKILVFLETKIYSNELTQAQIDAHEELIPETAKPATKETIKWEKVLEFLVKQKKSLEEEFGIRTETNKNYYIISNFVYFLESVVFLKYLSVETILEQGRKKFGDFPKRLHLLLENEFSCSSEPFLKTMSNKQAAHIYTIEYSLSKKIVAQDIKRGRLILKPGTEGGRKLGERMGDLLKGLYQIAYTGSYPTNKGECSIPFESINPYNLRLISNNHLAATIDVRQLVEMTIAKDLTMIERLAKELAIVR